MISEIIEINKKIIHGSKVRCEWAWRIIDAADVLQYINLKGGIVLGGDLLDDHFEYTYNDWSFEEIRDADDERNSELSCKKALRYLELYRSRFGSDHYVIFVVNWM